MIGFLKRLFHIEKPREEYVTNSRYLILDAEETENLINILRRMIDVKYKYGAEIINLSAEPENIKTIDCSELVEYAYHKTGYKVRDGSYNQFTDSDVFTGECVPGDLLFRRNKKDSAISHVGIYIGSDKIIEASGSAGKVVERFMEEFARELPSFKTTYAGIRRLIADKVKKI